MCADPQVIRNRVRFNREKLTRSDVIDAVINEHTARFEPPASDEPHHTIESTNSNNEAEVSALVARISAMGPKDGWRMSQTGAVDRSDLDRSGAIILFEFKSDLLRYSSGRGVVGVDDRNEVNCPQGISSEVTARRCGFGRVAPSLHR